jgi:hypothetical protein
VTRWIAVASEQLDRGWVWLYTAGAAAEVSSRRREELDCDQWEMLTLAKAEGWSDSEVATQTLSRWLRGLPADMFWRLSLGRKGIARESLTDLVSALLLLGGVLAALPLSMFLILEANGFSGHAGDQILFAFILPVVALLCVGGLMVQEVRPTAGTAVVFLGCLSLSLVLWWTVTIPVLGLLCAAGVVFRARHLKR